MVIKILEAIGLISILLAYSNNDTNSMVLVSVGLIGVLVVKSRDEIIKKIEEIK